MIEHFTANIGPLKKKTLQLILALFFGASISYSIFPWLVHDVPFGTFLYAIFFLGLIAFFSTITFFLVSSILIPQIQKSRTNLVIIISLLFLIIGWLITIKIPIRYPSASIPLNLSIRATGVKQSKALGSEVWLQEAYRSGNQQIKLSDFQYKNGWEPKNGMLVSYQSQPADLNWSGRTNNDIRLVFISHPWSGEVEITTNGQSKVIDLYNAVGTTISISIPISIKELSPVNKIIFLSLTSLCISFYLVILFLWIVDEISKQILLGKLNFKVYWDNNFFFTEIFTPLSILLIYFISFKFLSSSLLLQGVNSHFTGIVWKLLLGILTLACLVFIFGKRIRNRDNDRLNIKFFIEKFSFADLLLLLFPLTPIVQYIINNQDILSALHSFYVFAFFTLFSGIFIVLIPVFFGFLSTARTLRVIGAAFAFTISSMAILSNYFAWYEFGNIVIQCLFFSIILLFLFFLYKPNNKKTLYFFIILIFVTNSVAQGIPNIGKTENDTSQQDDKLFSFVLEEKPGITPNIYLLVYDAYVPNETMLSYGIDNSAQEDYLLENGFKLYPHTYSIGATTVDSMSRVLNISSTLTGNKRKAVSGDGRVQDSLKYLGYTTYGIFPYDYMFRGIDSSYNISFPKNVITPDINLISAVLTGEFKFDAGFEMVPHDQFVEMKQSIFTNVSGKLRFIYAHTNLPNHSQNSGKCLPNEKELYKERLIQANLEMQMDVDSIIKQDPEAIIVVAGDHGPYLTKNCTITTGYYDNTEISRLDIQDRFGSFLAIRWPTKDFEAYDDISVTQDLFPAIFAYIFKDASILNLKINHTNIDSSVISGVNVNNGIIVGGIDNGGPLFLSNK